MLPVMKADRLDTLARRSIIRGAAVLGIASLAGCTGSDGEDDTESEPSSPRENGEVEPDVGYLTTLITDDPHDIDDFEECIVTVEGIWRGPSLDDVTDDEGNTTDGNDTEVVDNTTDSDNETVDTTVDFLRTNASNTTGPPSHAGNTSTPGNHDQAETAQGSGREYLAFEEPVEADLVLLQDGETQLLEEDMELAVGTYAFLQLHISEARGTLTESMDGEEVTIRTPGNAPMQFNTAFDIRPGKRTRFTADVAPVRQGNGRYLLRPVARGIDVTYEAVE